mgnify:CR=1 FL=1
MNEAQYSHTAVLPATPQQVYDLLVDPVLHSAFSGAPAVDTDRLDRDFSAYNGYCAGRNLELVPGRLIRQTWWSSSPEWPAGHASLVVFELEAVAEGTRVQLTHTQMPEIWAERTAQGWISFYFEPMQKWLVAQAEAAR